MAFGQVVQKAELGLRDWLKTSEWKNGSRLPSERALAKSLGFQHYALNRAMSRLIAAGFVRRDGYKLFLAGEQAAVAPHFSCDLVVARHSLNIPGYRRVAREMGIKLSIHTWTSAEEAGSILNQLKPDEVQSVLFDPPASHPVSAWKSIAARLVAHGVPVVLVGKSVEEFSCVVSDHYRALEMALRHLVAGSHEHLAFLCAYPLNSAQSDAPDDWSHLCRENRLPTSIKRVKLHGGARFLRDDAREVADLFDGEWNKVTALVVSYTPDNAVPYLCEEFARRHRHVPQDLSLICLADSKSLSVCTPPITVTAFDISIIAEAAFHFAQRAAREKKVRLILPPPFKIYIGPQLVLRGSTAPLSSHSREPSKEVFDPLLEDDGQTSPIEKARDLALILQRPYSMVTLVTPSRFTPLDLSPYVNRPLHFRRSWLGDLPLKDFPPGEHTVHGVPFQILGGRSRSDCGAIIFHSATNARGNGLDLPCKLSIPIRRKAKAIYILHGCAYAKSLQTFASYDFYRQKTLIESVPLVTLGRPPSGQNARGFSRDMARANIQDWWPDFPHGDFPHARMAPILQTDDEHAHLRHVYLYTLEWINPSPGIPVGNLKITVDPSLSTTLGVLAVSVLAP